MKRIIAKILILPAIAAALFFILPQTASAAITAVQTTGVQSSGQVASQSIAFSSNVTAGNLLVVEFGYWSNTGASTGFSVTDSQGNIYTQDVIQGTGGNEHASSWRAIAGSSAANTVTITALDANHYITIGIAEFSGVNTVADYTSNLAAWWKLDEGTSTSTADSSGNSHTGTLTNGPSWFTVNKIGPYGLGFDGSDDYIDFGNILNFTSQDFSFSYWLNPSTIPSAAVIGFKGAFNNNGYYIYIGSGGHGGSNIVGMTLNGSSVTRVESTSNAITAGVWQHVVITRSGNVGKVYVNGQDVTDGSSSSLGDPNSSTNNFKIGLYDASDFPYAGLMDDVRVYTEALSQANVTKIYQRGVDLIGTNSGTANSSNASAGSITSDVDGSLYVGSFVQNDGDISGSNGSGFSTIYNQTNNSSQAMFSEYQVQSTAGSLTTNWTSTSAVWAAVAAAFRPSSSPPPPPATGRRRSPSPQLIGN